MNSTGKSSNIQTSTHSSWVAGVLADIRYGQRRLIEFNRVPRRTTGSR